MKLETLKRIVLWIFIIGCGGYFVFVFCLLFFSMILSIKFPDIIEDLFILLFNIFPIIFIFAIGYFLGYLKSESSYGIDRKYFRRR